MPPVIAALGRVITFLRIGTFLVGLGLIFAPPLAMFSIAAMMGELDEIDSLAKLLAEPLLVGLVLGTGPLLLGVPRLVMGACRPIVRWVAGLLTSVSILATGLAIKFTSEGSVTPFVAAAFLIEVAAFFFFVWPAPSICSNKSPDADLSDLST